MNGLLTIEEGTITSRWRRRIKSATSQPSCFSTSHISNILNISSGWGALGLYSAEETGADVTGVTWSVEKMT